jgi:hypothetical protein
VGGPAVHRVLAAEAGVEAVKSLFKVKNPARKSFFVKIVLITYT